MLKKTITYPDPFTDEPVSEVYYFHLNAADLLELEVSVEGGLKEKLTRIQKSNDTKEILEIFKQIIETSYGKRSQDGRFIKSPEISQEFLSSEAYSALLLDIMRTGGDEFINGLLPKNLDSELEKIRAKQSPEGAVSAAASEAKAAGFDVSDVTGEDARASEIANATAQTPVTLTEAEVVEMDSDVFRSGLATGRFKLS